MENNTLQHHGIKGQKWGVRRFQNADGSLTAAGKKRVKENLSAEQKEERKRQITKVALGTITVAAATAYVYKNPEKITAVIDKAKNIKASEVKDVVVKKGKEYVKSAIKGTIEGIDESIHDAPKKAAKAVVTGLILNEAKRTLDSAVGKEESARIFQANDNKKIGKFWKVSPEDREEDD